MLRVLDYIVTTKFGNILYCVCFNLCCGCLTCFIVCGCFGNMCTCIYCVCIVCTVFFVLFHLCIFVLICLVCTSIRTTTTK